MKFLNFLRSKRHNHHQPAISLDDVFSQAKRPDEDVFEPPELSEKRKLLALQCRWHKVHPTLEVPDDRDTLSQIIPSNLSEREKRLWLWGCLCEAAHKYQYTLNTSRTKTELAKKCKAEGLMYGLEAFEPDFQEQIKDGLIKYLTD